MSVRTTRSPLLHKSILSMSLALAGLSAWGSAAAATYYVRTDGGSASQCNGLSDAAYPGSGTAQNCAWNNPSVALPNSGSARIAGGDTLLIGAGSYLIGASGYMQPVPSGPGSTARTRILGKAGTTPKLVGTNAVARVLNLDGSSNVEIGNLEITDGNDCVYKHSQSVAACPTTGTWARMGVYARNSRNVWMHDVNVHGLGHTGFHAGGLTDWTLERVKSNKNGRAGWDANIGTGSENAGKITMRDIEFGWNGCGERVSTGEPWACWGQQSGGYGDGFSSTATNGHGGQWLIEDAFIHHNTQDGLDLLYMNGADSTNVTLRRIHAVANTGQQIKVKGNSLIENSVIAGHCTYFKGKYYMLDTDLCRGYGAPVILVMTGNDTTTVRHNSIAGEGPNLITAQDGSSTDRINVHNNVGVGFPYYRGSGQTSFFGGPAPGSKSLSGNIAWNTGNCPTGTTCGTSPRLTNMTLAGFDPEPLSDSPVIDRAPMISAVTTDFLLGKRPTGAANDVGAYEYGATGAVAPSPTPEPTPSPTPTCERAAPTVTLTGPTGAVAAGSKLAYTMTVKNNDCSSYNGKTFNFASTVPSGWTGTLGASSYYIAPGTTYSTTLTVTSPSNAPANTYGIGVGASSSYAIHTGSASATYTVAAPVLETCTRKAPTVTLTGPNTAVVPGTTVKYMLSVRNNDCSSYNGKTFNFASTVPSGWTGTLGTSSYYIAPGATYSTTLTVTSASNAAVNTYGIGAGVSSSYAVHTGSASSTYRVAAPVVETCSRKAPTITLAGPTTAVAPGTTVNYTLSVRNNDCSSYNGKTFKFASSVPSGWAGALASTSSYIVPGATFTTTLSVKSPTTAAAGTYRVGAGVSSSYSIHTASTTTSQTIVR